MTVVDKAVVVIQEEFGDKVRGVEVFCDQTTVVIDRECLVECCALLREEPQLLFDRLSSVIGVDYWPHEPRFAVVYQLYSLQHRAYLGLKVPLASHEADVHTLEGIYRNANWFEREVYDMFGITFQGHSDMRRLLTPHDWQGHPLRKDYPLGHEEVQFTFNFDRIQRQKRFAKR